MKVILDANFLMVPLQFNVDIFSELERVLLGEGSYELATIALIEDELGDLGQKGKAARDMIKLNNVKVHEIQAADADTGLLEFAQAGDFLCTQDKELKRLAKAKGIRIITLVSQNHLAEV